MVSKHERFQDPQTEVDWWYSAIIIFFYYLHLWHVKDNCTYKCDYKIISVVTFFLVLKAPTMNVEVHILIWINQTARPWNTVEEKAVPNKKGQDLICLTPSAGASYQPLIKFVKYFPAEWGLWILSSITWRFYCLLWPWPGSHFYFGCCVSSLTSLSR